MSDSDLQADGKIHELRRNLLEAHPACPHTPKCPVRNISLSVYGGETPPATFELLDVRFLSRPDSPPMIGSISNDAPLHVVVKDGEGQTVSGATVIVDAERRNWARRDVTGEDGLAVLVPLINSGGEHTLRVEKGGMFPTEKTRVIPEGNAPIVLTVVPAVHYGGFVRNSDGAPVAGADIGFMWKAHGLRNWGDHAVKTDAEGRWRSPPLPVDVPALSLGVWHPDYDFGPHFLHSKVDIPMQALREGTAVTVVTRGATVSGQVVCPYSSPGSHAVVKAIAENKQREPHLTVMSDGNGLYRLDRVPRGAYTLTVSKDGYAPSSQPLRVEDKPVSVNFSLCREQAAQKAPAP